MDTLTHAVLGGAIAYVVAGKISPKKAILWGAAMAISPDIDIFIPHASALDAVTMHRSWSHSWLVQSLIAPIIAFFLHKKDQTFNLKMWWLIVWLALLSHSALDAFTVYGTQLFWPFMPPPTSIGSIFIIDPIFTIPLLAGVIAILLRPASLSNRRLIFTSLIFSCCYIVSGLLLQHRTENQTKIALNQQQINYQQVLVTPTPFNLFLWRILVVNKNYYYQGFRSIFDADKNLNFSQYDRHSELKPLLKDVPSLDQLEWFTHGFYALEQQNNQLIARDLRMGIEPIYFFQFVLAEHQQQQVIPVIPYRPRSAHVSLQDLQRIWDDKIQLNVHVNAVSADINS